MSEQPTQRRLAAIMVADVVGYSRLMGQDEAGTLAALKALRIEIIDPKIAEHSGRIFKFTGDGCLAEFPSVVNAVACATEIQRGMAERNRDKPQNAAIQLRIGVNLGDVIVEAGDVFGDGVNVAARIEGIAPPGGIAVTETVRDHLGSRLDIQFADLGEQKLKNIDRPVRAYKVEDVAAIGSSQPIASGSRTERPSIAVLPFNNMSGDPEQEYFADGITEDIITELSRFSSLLVIARNSSFQYRNRPADMRKVGEDLGAKYLVEGSVRRLGPRIRITAQLIQAADNKHIWAERYDRKIEELFDVQDEVVRAIVTSTEHRLVESEVEHTSRRPPNSWLAYDYYLQARKLLSSYVTLDEAEAPLLRAIELDPGLAEAYAKLAVPQVGKFWSTYDPGYLERAAQLAQKSLALKETSDGHASLALAYAFQDRMDLAVFHEDRALALNPNHTLAAVDRAFWQLYMGDAEGALERLDKVLERDPIPPKWYWEAKGAALYQLKRYPEAIDALNMVAARKPWENAYIAASMSYLGQVQDARNLVSDMKQADPGITIANVLQTERYQYEPYKDHLVHGLRVAGLPE